MKLSGKGIGFPMHVPRNLRTLASGQLPSHQRRHAHERLDGQHTRRDCLRQCCRPAPNATP